MSSFLCRMMLNEEDGLAMGETGEGWVPAMPRLGQRVSRSEFVGYRSVIQSLWCIACEPEVGIVGMVNQILSWLPPCSQPALSLPSIPHLHCTAPTKAHNLTKQDPGDHLRLPLRPHHPHKLSFCHLLCSSSAHHCIDRFHQPSGKWP